MSQPKLTAAEQLELIEACLRRDKLTAAADACKAGLADIRDLTTALAAHAYPNVFTERSARLGQMDEDRALLERCGWTHDCLQHIKRDAVGDAQCAICGKDLTA